MRRGTLTCRTRAFGGVRLTGCVLLPAGAWLARCSYRLGAVLTERGVEIRGFTRTRKFDLSAIDRAYAGAGRTLFQSTKTLHLVLKTGADLRFQVISVYPGKQAKIKPVVEAINAAVSQA